MATEKIYAIEHLFFTIAGWDRRKRTLAKPLITSQDIVRAIQYSNKFGATSLGDKNPANFLKDIVRNDLASANWPKRIANLRFTARQVTRDKNVLVFLPYGNGQSEPFPDPYMPSKKTKHVKMQSLSLSLEAKELGRTDEAWLLQTAINLRVVETHFAISSKIDVLQIVHLQMSVKLANTEIDALFFAKCRNSDNELFFAIITCEAKQAGERILDMQICEQVIAVFKQRKLILSGQPITHVIPIAMRVIKETNRPGAIYVAEFPMVSRDELDVYVANKDQQLSGNSPMLQIPIVADGLYSLHPSVKGIG